MIITTFEFGYKYPVSLLLLLLQLLVDRRQERRRNAKVSRMSSGVLIRRDVPSASLPLNCTARLFPALSTKIRVCCSKTVRPAHIFVYLADLKDISLNLFRDKKARRKSLIRFYGARRGR